MSKITNINKWRAELQTAEKFRDDELGILSREQKTLAGENIDYYEYGYSGSINVSGESILTTLNIVDALISVIVPSLYFQNPKTIATPDKIESEDSAPLAAKILDYYRKKTESEITNRKCIFDSYLIGCGFYKIGYVTKFGLNIEDKEKDRDKKTGIKDRILISLGLKKEEESKQTLPEIDLRIISESPSIQYISPFDILIDPRARNINEAMWWSHSMKKTVKSIKDNKRFKNTENIKGNEPENILLNKADLSQSDIEEFHTVNLHEIHYRNEDDFYLLYITDDGNDEYREHYHEKSIYKMNEWLMDMLTFKQHGLSLYPKSDITKIKPLQDRITMTIDAILEQVDKFVPKLAYASGDVTEQGKKALLEGIVGALVECNKNPQEVFKELNFTQLKADLQALIDQLINLITVQTGITKAQLLGASQANTATEAQIEQGGQTLRLSDMANATRFFVNKQSKKLWKIVTQFVNLQELELINGVRGTDEETGQTKYDWLTVDPLMEEKLINGEYDFDIEVGSTEKTSLAIVRKAFENLFNILARTEVIALMQQQGDKVVLAEILKKYVDLFPEMGIDSGKIIQRIQSATGGMVDPMALSGKGGTTSGSNQNSMEAQMASPAPSAPQMMSEAR